MRICHLTSEAKISGRFRYILELSRHQRARGHEAIIVMPDERPDGASAYDQLVGDDLVESFGRPLAFKARRLLGKLAPDIIHCHGGTAPRWLRWMRRRPPTVATLHQTFKPAFAQLDGLIAISDWQRSALQPYRGPVAYVPNWLPELPAPKDADVHAARVAADAAHPATKLILFIGRMIPNKGPDIILEAFSRLPDHLRASARLALVGDGELRVALSERAKTVPGVSVHGFAARPQDWYGAADIVAAPSRYEPFGLVALEAMASGAAIVGAAVGGLASVLETCGAQSVPPEDPEALSAALAELLVAPLPPEYDLSAYHPDRSVAAIMAFYEQVR